MMSAWLLLSLLLAAAADVSSSGLKFGIINGASLFFQPVALGWNNTCERLGVECIYDDSKSYPGMTEQELCEKKILDLVAAGVSGIAVGHASNCPQETMQNIIKEVTDQGVAVVTFDRDVANSTRSSYVGTDNRLMGKTMGRLLRQLRPEGGNFVIIGGSDGSQNERETGFIEEITKDNDRDDRAHWHLLDDPDIARLSNTAEGYIGQMDWYAEKHSPTAFVIMRQTPMRAKNWTDHVDLHHHRDITYIGTDGSDYQLSYLHRKYVDGLIGQLPYEFGSSAIQTLFDLVSEKKTVDDHIPTNLVAYNLIPLELPDLNIDQNLLGGYKYIGWSCFVFLALAVFACLGWTFANRSGMAVRASQPGFLAMTAFGILVMASAIIPLSFDDGGDRNVMSEALSVGICMSTPWLAFTGFTITFSALFSKTWRINTLLGKSSHFVRIQVTPKEVLGPFAMILTCNWIVLACWTVMDPLTYERQFYAGTDFWNREFSSYGSCRSENVLPFVIPLGVLNLFVVGIAAWQAAVAKGIETEFSEAYYIGLSMFSLCQAYLTGIPMAVIVRDIPLAFYLVMVFLLFLLCLIILMLIFVPKMILQRNYSGMTQKQQREMMALQLQKSMKAPSTGLSNPESGQSSIATTSLRRTAHFAKQEAVKHDSSMENYISNELKMNLAKMSDPTSSSGGVAENIMSESPSSHSAPEASGSEVVEDESSPQELALPEDNSSLDVMDA